MSIEEQLLAVIPARGGSERIPKKNIALLQNQPLITYTIRAALESELFSKVVVSTDDDEIAEIALATGAEVPFRRDAQLADEHMLTGQVHEHRKLSHHSLVRST